MISAIAVVAVMFAPARSEQPAPIVASASVAAVSRQNDAPLPGALSPRNANYDIDVRLDHSAKTLTGRETIRWRNISRHATSELQFHLYW
ncbi:MAG: hypothetical protein ACRD2A_17945, partial [Vicinamibacterales bacterium]